MYAGMPASDNRVCHGIPGRCPPEFTARVGAYLGHPAHHGAVAARAVGFCRGGAGLLAGCGLHGAGGGVRT